MLVCVGGSDSERFDHKRAVLAVRNKQRVALKCFTCGGIGHVVRDAPKKNDSADQQTHGLNESNAAGPTIIRNELIRTLDWGKRS